MGVVCDQHTSGIVNVRLRLKLEERKIVKKMKYLRENYLFSIPTMRTVSNCSMYNSPEAFHRLDRMASYRLSRRPVSAILTKCAY